MEVHTSTNLAKINKPSYLLVLPIPVGLEAVWGMQLNSSVADDLDTAFLIIGAQRAHTTVHL